MDALHKIVGSLKKYMERRSKDHLFTGVVIPFLCSSYQDIAIVNALRNRLVSSYSNENGSQTDKQ